VATARGENSSALRSVRTADPFPAPLPALSVELLRSMESLQRSAEQVAATALAGLRRGLFVIPTHPHIRADAAKRLRGIERGFEALAKPS
jgi:hypothetical protein